MPQPATSCVHIGADLQHTRGVNTPIHPSSAFVTATDAENLYPRYYNTPNQRAVVQKLCALEHAETGLLFSSGMAAVSTALFSFLGQGDHAVFAEQLYGGTLYLLSAEFEKRGISYTFVKGREAADFAEAIRPETKVLYVESPSNPLLQVFDLEAITGVARKHELVSMIDNTFASPINQNPIQLGFSLVIHSGTKYLGGHSDLSFGAILTDKAHYEYLYPTAINYGGNLNALDLYLIERSLKTLELRVTRQNQNAQRLAEFLDEHPAVEQVFYPGLPRHPLHAIARQQMPGGFGGMLSFELGVKHNPAHLLEKLQIVLPALSLGGVETLVCVPAQTSHLKVAPAEREAMGISERLLRVSVGIEDVEDLKADFAQALAT